MKYRYFYDTTGKIVGWCSYQRVCYAAGVSNSVGYVDSVTWHESTTTIVDLATKSLIQH